MAATKLSHQLQHQSIYPSQQSVLRPAIYRYLIKEVMDMVVPHIDSINSSDENTLNERKLNIVCDQNWACNQSQTKENKGSDDTAIRTHMVEGFRRQKINLLGCNKSIKGLEKLWSILEEASVVSMMCMIAT